MLDPRELLDDHERMVREGEALDDDLIRGASPSQVAIPFFPAMLGSPLRLLPESVLGEELALSWEEALAVRLDPSNPWYRLYFRLFRELTEELWRRLPLWGGGWFDAQYCLWAPGPIARLQEDASAVFSPTLYNRLVAPADRLLARHFPCAFMHLHSTSMFLLDAFLEIEELRCFEINNDAAGPPLGTMVPFFQRVQRAGRSLLVRGAFTPEELRLLLGSLEPRGLMLLVMVRDAREVDALRPMLGL
jgi:hypothetical protein